jgi:hypothetical protein
VITVVNLKDVPFVYDDEGRVLGAFERLDVDEDSDRIVLGLEMKHLMKIQVPAQAEEPVVENASAPDKEVSP